MVSVFVLLLGCAAHTPPANLVPVAPGAPQAAYGPAPAVIRVAPGQAPIAGLPAVTTASGLKYWVLQEGSGPTPERGQTAAVNYTGWLADGTQFDSSSGRGQPLEFVVGAGRVIKGWDEAVAGMKVGEKRRIEVPPDLGYGDRGAGGVIPPGATLVFEVELVAIEATR